MQNPQSVHTGDLVEIRRHRWRVLDICAYPRCQLLTVAGVDPANANIEQRFLLPFEAVAPLGRARAPRFVRPRRWRRACRAVLAACTPPGGLRAARLARIDLLPHQLEPALAVVRAHGSRILLADDVGLGKTIQAGLILAELRARGQAERVLVATPAGLRDQWCAELHDRFAIAATLVDGRELRRRAATAAIGVNPWITTPLAVASIDYLKRPEVFRAVRACRWDVLVVDEAHGAGGDSDRHAAVSALAARAAYVVLMTATPHNGDAGAFASLCGIGALDDPLLVFRRTRDEVQLGAARRVHRLAVRPSRAEARMHALLAGFTAAVRREHDSAEACLALAVLHKRAFSSAGALARTVGRRLEGLGPEAAGGPQQMALPLVDHGEYDAADDPPDCLVECGLADERRERRLLDCLRRAAEQAAVDETKIRAVRRLIRRCGEPMVIFTEFRDTLLSLRTALGVPAALLHGGLTRDERRAALDDFSSGRRRILLATDAAGEGLNLHQRCRFVINLELPWNPMRLEQRIGRVDRIGQARTVHACHLIARDTGEVRVLERLRERIARAGRDIAVADPLDEAGRLARYVIDRTSPPADALGASRGAGPVRLDPARVTIDLRDEARLEAARLLFARRLDDRTGPAARVSPDTAGPWIVRARRAGLRARLGRRLIAVLRIDHEDGAGRLAHWTLVALTLPLVRGEAFAAGLQAWLPALGAALESFAGNVDRQDRGAADLLSAFAAIRLAREQRIARHVAAAARLSLQPGLFDRRAERESLAARSGADGSATDLAARIQSLEAQAVVAPRPARLLLMLVP